MGLRGGKYFIKIIFDIKIEIGIFEILDVPNFNKFWAFLKLVSATSYQILIFHQMKAFKIYEKCFLFNLKSSFRSWDIQIFVFPSSTLFLFASHCFKGCSKINLKVYYVMNCLNKNLIMHFVWYLEKEKRYDIETLSIDRVLNKKHFYGKNHTENVH